MPDQDVITEAQRLIGGLWKENQSPERTRLLECASYTLSFIFTTGQDYQFEDFRQKQVPASPTPIEQGAAGSANLRELLARTHGLFAQLLAEPETFPEQGPVRAILDAVDYIVSVGQLDALNEHIRKREAGSPPHVVAVFDTRGEAAAWLERAPEPPRCALVLIGDQYHQALYIRDINHRNVIPWPAMEYYLAELAQDVAPTAVASFATREAAEAWLKAQTEPADRAWVLIAGEFHLAVHHANVQHRALYPLSMADGYTVNDEVEAEPPSQG